MKRTLYFVVVALFLFSLASCDILALPGASQPASGPLKASGTISADTIRIAAEISGRIVELKANKGDTLESGAVAFKLDTASLNAQRDQAQAAIQAAQA